MHHADFYTSSAAVGGAALAFGFGLFVLLSAPRSRRAHRGFLTLAFASIYACAASAPALAADWDPVALRLTTAAAVLLALLGGAVVAREWWITQGPPAVAAAHPTISWTVRAVILGGAMLAGLTAVGYTLVRAKPAASPYADYPAHVAYVRGTCTNSCGLNRRAAPDLHARARGEQLADGDRVRVLCQRYGGLVSLPGNRRSWLWDLLTDKTWVSDLFLSTSKSGAVSVELPRCPVKLPA